MHNNFGKIWERTGILVFWASWPLLHVYLRLSKRTRVLVVCGDYMVVVKGWLGTGKWALPGGGLHRHENSAEGVMRELQEETGLAINPAGLKPLLTDIYQQNGLRFGYQCFVVELSEMLVLKPQIFELLDAAWVKKDRLSSRNAGPDVVEAIKKWYSPLENLL